MDRPGTAVTRAFSWSLPLLSGGIFGALSTLATVGDPDLFWHLAQGRQTITDGLARVDTFSWSVNGLPVLTDQWLGQVLWYEAYAALGWNGIIVLRAVLVAAIVTLILATAAIACAELWLRRPDARRVAVGVVAACIAVTLLTPSGISIWTSASGHFLSPPRVIQEEGVPDVTQPYGFLFAFIVLAVLVTAQLSRPAGLRDVALLVPVLFVSMTAARHTPFFAVASAPYLAAHAPAALGAIAAHFCMNVRLPDFAPRVPSPRIDVATLVIALAAIVGAGLVARDEPNLSAYP